MSENQREDIDKEKIFAKKQTKNPPHPIKSVTQGTFKTTQENKPIWAGAFCFGRLLIISFVS